MSNIDEKEFKIKVLAEKIANRIHYYCIYESDKGYTECLLDELDKYKHNPKLYYYLRLKIYDLMQRFEEMQKLLDEFAEWNKGL